jgi:hypothetical protein
MGEHILILDDDPLIRTGAASSPQLQRRWRKHVA